MLTKRRSFPSFRALAMISSRPLKETIPLASPSCFAFDAAGLASRAKTLKTLKHAKRIESLIAIIAPSALYSGQQDSEQKPRLVRPNPFRQFVLWLSHPRKRRQRD